MRRGWLVAISAVLSLLIAGAMLLAVSDCLRSCSQVELSKVLDVLAEKVAEAENAGKNGDFGSGSVNGGNNSAGDGGSSGSAGSIGSAGSVGNAARDPEFQDAAVPSVPCSLVVRIGDPCVRTLRDVPVRR